MRNLLGRLHARPAVDLDRIAAFWRVPLGSGDRHGRVGSLYRVMIDPVAARDVWARLAADEAEMLRVLASGDPGEEAPTLADLAEGLGVPEPEARETALRLYRIGLLAREGDGETLPVGESPRLFLPRELSLLFRRVLDEIDLGDRSETPLNVLVEWLDDGELDEAAEAWGVTTVPGVRRRAEIGRRLLRQVADEERVARVVRGLGPEARRIWDALCRRPTEGPLPLAEAAALLGLGPDAPDAARFRHALGQLERSLLAWHTYRPDGSRWLFVPAEVRDPRPPPAAPLPPLLPLLPVAVREPLARPPFAIAWDLLTLLREMQSVAWPAADAPPRLRLRGLNRRFWNAGAELPPAGYVPFLVRLATAEGLVEEVAAETLLLTPAVRRWRDLTFAEQSKRLRERWLADPEWTEGEARDEVEIRGVEWPRVRRRLLALLADPKLELTPGRWYALDSRAARIAAREPMLLGRSFTAATARLAGEAGAGASEEEARAAAIGDCVAVELKTAFNWFGFVDLGDSPGEGRGVRLIRHGLAPARETPTTDQAEPDSADGPALVVNADGAICLVHPSPGRVWALSAFADLEALRPEARFRLSAASLRRALESGFDAAQVTAFLERQARAPLPAALAEQVDDWHRAVRRVRLRSAFVLTPDDAVDAPALLEIAADHGWEARPLAEGGVLVVARRDEDQAVRDALLVAGFSPVAVAEAKPVRLRRESTALS